jgi:hypothetical protein
MTEHCCEQLTEAVEAEAIVHAPRQHMHGRILNEVDSDYAVGSPEERRSLYLINFCPFCGRAISRSVWNAEKKK